MQKRPPVEAAFERQVAEATSVCKPEEVLRMHLVAALGHEAQILVRDPGGVKGIAITIMKTPTKSQFAQPPHTGLDERRGAPISEVNVGPGQAVTGGRVAADERASVE